MENSVKIYALTDGKGDIRYIGKTSQYLKQRLYNHIVETKSNKKSHKISWIKSLLNKGERPVIEVIDEVPESEWEFWEKYWIEQFKVWGFRLTNLTSGGQGGNDFKHTKKAKKKMQHAKLGVPLSDEHKGKISMGVKKKFEEDPMYNRSGNNVKKSIDRDLLYKLYITDNLTMPKCAEELGVSETTVFRNLKEYNIVKSKEVLKKQYSTQPTKTVLQYDLEGNLIKEWPEGPVYVQKVTGIEVARCCRGLMKTSKGFIWRYKDEWFDLGLDKGPSSYVVEKYTMGGDYICEYSSVRMASRETKCSSNSISNCCKGLIDSFGGYVWKYK